MSHKNRGYALIFNHENFKSADHKRRLGTNVDCRNLRQTLTDLRFDVKIYEDKTKEQIRNIMTKMSAVDHSENDCILIVIMSHGELGVVFAYDDDYSVESVTSFFRADRCRSLAGKPKLFFIQACRGDEVVPGVETDSVLQKNYKIPAHADFLIAYSTVEGFLSHRDISKGSWFIQSICEQLRKNGTSRDILQILTKVNRQVSTDFQRSIKEWPNQISSVTHQLTKTLIFKDHQAIERRTEVSLPKRRPYTLVKEISPAVVNKELAVQLAHALRQLEEPLTNRKAYTLAPHKSDAVAVDSLANREVRALAIQRTFALVKEISPVCATHELALQVAKAVKH